MNESLNWRNSIKFPLQKIKKENEAIEKLLRDNETNYVSACSRFISRDASKDPLWVLSSNSGAIEALIINSRSTLMPVFCRKEIPFPDIISSFLKKKYIHSIQGLTHEVDILQDVLDKNGMEIKDIIDFDLMSLDTHPLKIDSKTCPSNLELCIPSYMDLEGLVPLQAGYEKEEVVPKGSVFNPASSRLNIANIVKNGKILAAKIDGRFVGKININAVSFTRYQIGGVYVLPEYRGLGIGRKMTQNFIKPLIDQGKGLTLFVKKINIAAIKLYKSLGFMIKDDYRITYY